MHENTMSDMSRSESIFRKSLNLEGKNKDLEENPASGSMGSQITWTRPTQPTSLSALVLTCRGGWDRPQI